MKALAAFALALAAVVLAAVWGGGPERACPAIGWGSRLVVELGDERPEADAVRVECPSPCGLAVVPTADGPDSAIVPVSGATAFVPFTMSTPESVTATVLAGDGTVLTTARLDLDWVRVGGSAECGGPQEATAAIP